MTDYWRKDNQILRLLFNFFCVYVSVFSRSCLLGTCFLRAIANPSSLHKQSSLHQEDRFVWAVGLCFFALTLIAIHYPEVKEEYVFIASNIGLFISQLIICTSYLKIRNRLRASSPGLDIHGHQLQAHNLRLSKTLFITIASSLVFWIPGFVVYSTREFCPQCFPVPVLRFANAMYLANSMVNPFVYSFRMPIFKDALKKFYRKRQQNIGPGLASRHVHSVVFWLSKACRLFSIKVYQHLRLWVDMSN